MGNSPNSQLTNLLSHYQLLSPTFQGLTHLKSKQNHKNYFLKQLYTPIGPQRWNIEALLRQRLKYSHQHILFPSDYLINSQRKQSQEPIAWVIYQSHDNTLEQEMKERVGVGCYFSEEELWSILASIVLAHSYLQGVNIRNEALRSSNIFVDNNGEIKVLDPLFNELSTNYRLVKANSINPSDTISASHLSPCQKQSLKKNQRYPSHNSYKSTVFVAGLILLELSLLKNIHYDTQEDIKRFLEEMNRKYSKDLVIFVREMLRWNEEKRMNWIELEKFAHKDIIVPQANNLGLSQISQISRLLKIDEENKHISKGEVKNPERSGNSFQYQVNGKTRDRNTSQQIQSTNDRRKLKQNEYPTNFLSFYSDKHNTKQKFNGNIQQSHLQTKLLSNPPPPTNKALILKPNQHSVIPASRPMRSMDAQKQLHRALSPSPQPKRYHKDKESILSFENQRSFYQTSLQHQKPTLFKLDLKSPHKTSVKEISKSPNKNYYSGNKKQSFVIPKHIQTQNFIQNQQKNIKISSQPKNQQIFNNQYRIVNKVDHQNFGNFMDCWIMYTGETFEGRKNGKGRMLFSDSSIYEGQFKNNMIEGEGKYIERTRCVRRVWKNNALINVIK